MKRLFTEKRLTILTLVLALGLAIAWFTVPKAFISTVQSMRNIAKNNPSVTMDDQTRERIEKDIRETSLAIKSGDKRGGSNFVNHYLGLGINYETLGRYEVAEDAYRRAIVEDPSNYIPYANLASLHQARGEYGLAIDQLRNAIERDPKQEGLYIRLAELHWYRLNDLEAARGAYMEGIIRTNNIDKIVRSFASFLEQTNQKKEAILYFEALSKQNPQDAELKKHLEDLKARK